MNYVKHYTVLVERARDRTLDTYTEGHHVIPKCMGGDNSSDNLVNLTPEEHYVAHQLLCKMYPGNRGLYAAALYMCTKGTNHQHRSNKVYGWLRRQLSESMKGNNHYLHTDVAAREKNQLYMRSDRNPQKMNPRSGVRHHYYGKSGTIKRTDETKKNISLSKAGDKNPGYGRKPWKDGKCIGAALDIWLRADDVYSAHLSHPTYSYMRLAKIMNLDDPYRCASVLKKIKQGWVPQQDIEWNSWKDTCHN